jgi:hypothetical protein
MSSLVLGQHSSLQLFDLELEDTPSIGTHGTRCALKTMFWVVGVGMPPVHTIQEWGTDQCTEVQAFPLPRNEIPPSWVILSGRHNLQLESIKVGIVCMHNSFSELVLLSNYV